MGYLDVAVGKSDATKQGDAWDIFWHPTLHLSCTRPAIPFRGRRHGTPSAVHHARGCGASAGKRLDAAVDAQQHAGDACRIQQILTK